ncbi:MAG: hypothetical protein ABJP45_07285 [Cyclobacteriaceae bacterium]
MKGIFKSIAIIFYTVASAGLIAQDSGFIYGKVTTEDGDVYEGPLRWGKEEVFWTDMFNASKEDNRNLDYLSNRERESLEDRYYSTRYGNGVMRLMNVSWDFNDNDRDNDFVHQFACEFGNIKSLDIRSRSRVYLELQDGTDIEIDGNGYNDIGAKIRVLDRDLGLVSLSWSRIEEIEFLETPSRLEEKFGEPLYGTVESDLGTFTGFVQWDHDERVGTDVLDGDTRDGDVSIPFSKIESIERDGYSSSIVKLKSGRELDLRGSNDVNDDNKGIIVTVEGMGRIDLEWEDFDKVTFKNAPNSGPDYGAFSKIEKIKGQVEVDNGDVLTGEIVYDLDEEYTFEVLNGEDNDTEYIIPFRNVKSIEPRSSDRALVVLKNGDTITMEDAQDVSERNQGILVKTTNDRVYIPWDRVRKVTIR